jgi:rubredoxin
LNKLFDSLGIEFEPSDFQTFFLMANRTFMCIICGLVYDEAEGWPEDGIAAGTRWEDVPDDWQCPDCDATKADFEMIEI